MKLMNKAKIFAAAALIVLIAIGFALLASEGGAEKKPLRIGVSVSLSGSAAFIGNSYLDGLNLALKEINDAGGVNGRKIELVVEDNKNEAKEGINVFRALETRNPDLILSTMSTSSVAMSPVVKESGKPMFVSMVFADVLSTNDNAVSFFPKAADDARATVEDMKKNDVKTAGILFLNTFYGNASADAFIHEAQNAGIDIIITESFTGDLTDYSTPLLKIKSRNPQAVYIATINAIPVINSLKTMDNSTVVYTNLIPVFGSLVYKNPDVFEGVHLTAPLVSIEGTENYVSFRKIAAGKINIINNTLGYTSVAYDNLHVIAKVLKRNENVTGFVRTFSSYGEFTGINGNYMLDGRDVGMKLYPVVFKNGRLYLI